MLFVNLRWVRRTGPTNIEKRSEGLDIEDIGRVVARIQQDVGERSGGSGMDAKGIDHPPGTLEENLFVWMLCRASVPQILVKSLLDCAQYLLDKVPKRMTLGCLRILAALLVIVVPRPVTYVLLYPIFRLVFGNLYPAYASYKAVRTKNVKEYVKWMMYWIVFALFTCAETFTDVFFSFWFPFYYEIKTILVVWLLSPATKGSSILYRRFVHPALIRREAEIDEALARATEQGYTAVLHLGSKGVNYATTVLMQTAIKRILSADPTALRELSASQSDSALSSSAKRPAASTPQSEVIQENDHPTTSRTSSSPSLSLDDFVPVEEVPSIHADMNTDNDLYLDAEPATFKVPEPKKTKRSQRTKRERGEPSRRLRSNTQEDFYANYGYSDDDI